jgi:DNA polymerase-4
MKTIFHLDLDAFFVSVERVLDPSLEGKPVIVGGDPNSRGVVAACSYEARKYGLHSAMPIKTAFKLCPHGIYLHGSHKEYTRFSKNVKKILENYSPMIEQTSIDEFFMDFTGCEYIYGSLFMFASKLQREIWDKLSLPCSIGIGSNKNVAKIGSDCMKPKGITYIIPGYEKEFLAPMPISVIPGVGKVTERTLNSKGFYIISDIQNTPEDYFSLLFGKYGTSLWNRANGEGSDLLTLAHKRKSISKETTFEIDVVDKNELEMALFNLVSKVAQSIRNKNWQTSTVGIKLRYSDFGTIIRDKTITATDDDKIIYENVVKLFRNNYNRRVGIRLIGVHTTNFSEAAEQEFLFDDSRISRKKMLKAVQKIRDKYGFDAIIVGGNESKNIR